ncbi:MAG: phosphoribosyltransferase family protein [Steroidobacter sp.]
MECFEDRSHAGRLLAERLISHRNRSDVVVLALPCGGFPVATEISAALDAPLDVMVVQKIGAPGHHDFTLGAIATDGVVALNDDAVNLYIDMPDFRSEAIREGMEMKRRDALYRGNSPPLMLKRRTVILVDDGAATGASMRAAVRAVRTLGAYRVVVALGVAPRHIVQELRIEADEVVCAKIGAFFCSIGQYYRRFAHVADEEITLQLTRPRPLLRLVS